MADRAITEGQTQPIRYILRREGGDPIDLAGINKLRLAATALNGEGDTAVFESTDAVPKVTIVGAAAGEADFTPDTLVAKSSPYVIRFWIYYNAAQREPAPPDNSERIIVFPNYGG